MHGQTQLLNQTQPTPFLMSPLLDSFFMASLLAILLSVQSFVVTLAISSSNFTDQLALLAFKSTITYEPNNILATNWTEKTNFCDWAGVRCSHRRQRVTALRFRDMGVEGTISPYIGNLSFLMNLDLANNSFHGYVPHELSNLRRLIRLVLQYNKLEGKIPPSIHQCPKLQIIALRGNNFSGSIPIELTKIPFLHKLYLGSNNLKGTIPPSVGNMSNLEFFGIEENHIHGNIPNEIGHLPNLKGFNFFQNHLRGLIPPAIFNISSLQEVLLGDNALSGTLPSTTGLWLPNLENLNVQLNELSGNIPLYLSNSSKLNILALSGNKFTGSVPTNVGQLKLLKWFVISENQLTKEAGSSELTFLTALTNCSFLEILWMDQNPLGGILPDSIGNLSTSVQSLSAYMCQIEGRIPRGIGSLNVNFLVLSENNLHGTIPSSIARMERLQVLHLSGNALEGSIPGEICLLRNLGELNSSNNKLSGSIPHCIGNLSNLQLLLLDSNSLNSSIPLGIWSLENLILLNLSSNFLSESLDQNIRPLKSLVSMDLSWNQISSEIPSIIGAFQSLISLNLSRNSFWGPIPKSLGNLITLDYLDLSHNNLSGTIPKALEQISHLKYLNLSSNKLSGEIPSGGPFKNLTLQSFLENEALCSQSNIQLPPCKNHISRKSWTNVVLGCTLPIIALVVIFVALLMLKKYKRNKMPNPNSAEFLPSTEQRMVSYHELCHATNNFSEANLLGVGSFGSVYKGILSDETIVAVKILNLQLEGAFKSFDAECKVLRTVRHRNLVRVISSCSNPELRALILQYMSNGSLDKWLYSESYCLVLLQRVNIMLDVAVALEYLHYGQLEPIVHCDLKPSNVLLDEDMVAHVGDFGIAKILAENKTTTHTKTLGTLGYIAPEYGSEGRVSTKGDMYSYGIMFLETFTRKKPTDEMFNGELSLRQWVNASLPNKILDVVDNELISTADGSDMAATQNNLLAVMELGLECSKELPEERSDIKEVVVKLNKIKLNILQNIGA